MYQKHKNPVGNMDTLNHFCLMVLSNGFTILYILSTQSMSLLIKVNLYLPSLYFTFIPGLSVTVKFIFTLRKLNVYKPRGFLLGFLNFICFCATVLFYGKWRRYVNDLDLYLVQTVTIVILLNFQTKNLK